MWWDFFSCNASRVGRVTTTATSRPGRGRVSLVANALTGDDALDETELEPFGTFNDEWTMGHFGERPSQEMLAGHRHGDHFERALHSSGDARRAGDVVNQDQPAVGLQHPGHLVECRVYVGYCTQPEGAHHRIECGVGEPEIVSITLSQFDFAAKLACTRAGDREHLLADIDPGQPYVGRVHGEVQPRADSDFKDIAVGLRARPAAGVAEQRALHEPHFAVVRAGLLVPVSMPPLSAILCVDHIDSLIASVDGYSEIL